jgi:hypothetical protein
MTILIQGLIRGFISYWMMQMKASVMNVIREKIYNSTKLNDI